MISSNSPGKRKTLLLVDDDSLLLWALKQTFKLERFEVKVYESAEEALENIGGQIFDLAVLDVCLPGADGISLMNTLKSRGICEKFIIISGFYDKSSFNEKDYPSASYQFLPKPFRMQEIMNIAKNLL